MTSGAPAGRASGVRSHRNPATGVCDENVGVDSGSGSGRAGFLLAGADNEATPSIKQVMVKLNKRPDSSLAKLKTELGASTPDWESIQKSTKDFAVLGACAGEEHPEEGR